MFKLKAVALDTIEALIDFGERFIRLKDKLKGMGFVLLKN
jgi:hypothetical protein